MALKEVTYFTVECDAADCGQDLSDFSDYSAWGDGGVACDEWSNADGLILDDGTALCSTHAAAYLWCDQCGDNRTLLRDDDGDPLCSQCKAGAS